MTAAASLGATMEAAFDMLVAQAGDDARKIAALAELAHWNGPAGRAYPLALRAIELAPGDAEVRSVTNHVLTAGVHEWHFRIVRDRVRNDAYEAVVRRAVTAESRVLDIGTGTGLLGMIAARAGAAQVVACEMNAAVADAAGANVARNGLSDRMRVVAKHSDDLDVAADLGGPVDVLVSEIVSNDLVGEGALPVMQDAARRLLKPGGAMIPASGQAMVALAHWSALDRLSLDEISGFDLSGFNRLRKFPAHLNVSDPELALRGDAAVLFDFDFAAGGPFPSTAAVELKADGGPVNGIVQWMRLELDSVTNYENRPGPGQASCWSAVFHPLAAPIAPAAGDMIRVRGSHGNHRMRIWAEA